MNNKYVLAGSILGILGLLFLLWMVGTFSNEETELGAKSETYPKQSEENLALNKEMEKRYSFYKENIKKYRLGLPREMYKDLNKRIHDAPDPNGIYKSTLPKGCNALYFTPEETDEDICDLMNMRGNKNVPTARMRYD